MKKIIVTLGCVLIAPLAFAQPSSTNNKQGTTTTEPIKVTGAIIKTTTEEGAAANYQPAKTLVVREDSSSNPGRYVLNGRGHVLNKAGGSRPNSDQARHSRACLLRKHGGSAYD